MQANQTNEQTPLLHGHVSISPASSVSLISNSDSNSRSKIAHVPEQSNKRIGDEEIPTESCPPSPTTPVSSSIGRIVSVLLIGGFISNADGSLLLATHPVIASEFNALHDSSWLMTSFGLAQAATQQLYGKLSDIYGRKVLLIFSYSLFALGLALVGAGQNMTTLIIGRVISGAGTSGMTALVSILITDLVPLRNVASWRSYVNVVATTGRSLGGPLGGWLADTVGWRWSFMGQVPFALIAITLVSIVLPNDTPADQTEDDDAPKQSKLARIDFIGSILMTLTILAFLFPLEVGGVRIPWSHPLIPGLLGGGLVLAILFILSQAYFAKEPIFPLELLRHRDVVISMFVMGCQSAAQMGMMFTVPLYFQITARVSNTVAGAHLVPAVFGNALGGILTGVIIKRTGQYKALTQAATLSASSAYLLLILRWHGHTNWIESFYIFPGGFGNGIGQSALFISLQAAIDPIYMAVAASSMYLASSVGFVLGMAANSAVLQEMLRRGLDRRLSSMGMPDVEKWEIIGNALSDVHYIDHAKPRLVGVVVASYVDALAWTHGVSLATSLLGFVATWFITQHKL